jgi:hypothetical protein
MNLLQVRTKFVQLSGRYDLVVDAVAYVDNGANFYINEGQKLLDKLCKLPETKANIYMPLAIGEYGIEFQHSCRAIKKVFVNTTEARTELTKVTLNELKNYYSGTVASIDNGAPTVYAIANLRALETTDRDSLGVFLNLTHAEDDTKYDYRGIIVAPPVDEAYVVEISGLFNQFKLTDDTDENYWSLEDPALLLKAAMYHLESLSRGTENAKNWISAIRAEAKEHDMDSVEELISDIDAMEG